MIINDINPNQERQNAIHPGESNTSRIENRLVLSSGRSNSTFMPETESYQAQLLGITESVDSLLNKWDLNQVQDFPFFPIATYQRMELIDAVRNIQAEIERSSLSPALKQAVAVEKLSGDASDDKIAHVLKNIISLRDTLSRELAVSKSDIEPGSILKLEA